MKQKHRTSMHSSLLRHAGPPVLSMELIIIKGNRVTGKMSDHLALVKVVQVSRNQSEKSCSEVFFTTAFKEKAPVKDTCNQNSTAWDFYIWESVVLLKNSVAQNELP